MAGAPTERDWREVTSGDTFIVAPHVSFDIDAEADVAYTCYYE